MITDELREWAHARFAGGFSDAMEREVDEIADRIDEQHRKALEKVAAMVDEHDAGWSGCRSCKAHRRGGVVECQVHGNMLRLDALERRIDRLDGTLDGMGKGAASRIEAIEARVSAVERKLNHKGVE